MYIYDILFIRYQNLIIKFQLYYLLKLYRFLKQNTIFFPPQINEKRDIFYIILREDEKFVSLFI